MSCRSSLGPCVSLAVDAAKGYEPRHLLATCERRRRSCGTCTAGAGPGLDARCRALDAQGRGRGGSSSCAGHGRGGRRSPDRVAKGYSPPATRERPGAGSRMLGEGEAVPPRSCKTDDEAGTRRMPILARNVTASASWLAPRLCAGEAGVLTKGGRCRQDRSRSPAQSREVGERGGLAHLAGVPDPRGAVCEMTSGLCVENPRANLL